LTFIFFRGVGQPPTSLPFRDFSLSPAYGAGNPDQSERSTHTTAIHKNGISIVMGHGGYPQASLGWFISWENPNLKWMMNRATPISGNLHM